MAVFRVSPFSADCFLTSRKPARMAMALAVHSSGVFSVMDCFSCRSWMRHIPDGSCVGEGTLISPFFLRSLIWRSPHHLQKMESSSMTRLQFLHFMRTPPVCISRGRNRSLDSAGPDMRRKPRRRSEVPAAIAKDGPGCECRGTDVPQIPGEVRSGRSGR